MTPCFDTIIIHIGLGKTGSSAIQQVLLEHAQELETRLGVLFPVLDDGVRRFSGNHSIFLRSLCSEQPETLRFNIAAGLGEASKACAADERVRAQLQHRFENTDASTLLLSAEGIGHFDDAAMARLSGWLSPLAKKIRLLAWIRHPRHSLAAEIQQRLKTGARLERLYQQPPYYRYSTVFARLARHFVDADIELYDYADSIAPGSSAITRFFHSAGIDLAIEEQGDRRVNVGLTYEATLMLDAINRLRPLVVDGQRNPLRRPNDIQKVMKVPGGPYAPPQSVYDRLDELVQPELDWLAQHYGFSPREIPVKQVSTPPTLDAAEVEETALKLLGE